jgi:hypothetical protein
VSDVGGPIGLALTNFLAGFRRRRVQRAATLLATLILAAGLAIAWRAHPVQLASLRAGPSVLLLGLALPCLLALNALDCVAASRALGRDMNLITALKVVVAGTAANFLPLPGGMVVRVASLRAAGSSYAAASGVILFQFATWLSLALLYSGAFAFALDRHAWGFVFAGVGIAILLPALSLAARFRLRLPALGAIVILRCLMVAGEALRLYLTFAALGIVASFGQASVVSLSGILGSAVAIVPSGLGVAELVAAGLAGIFGIDPAAGFLVAAFSRLANLVVVIPVALLLTLFDGTPRSPAA